MPLKTTPVVECKSELVAWVPTKQTVSMRRLSLARTAFGDGVVPLRAAALEIMLWRWRNKAERIFQVWKSVIRGPEVLEAVFDLYLEVSSSGPPEMRSARIFGQSAEMLDSYELHRGSYGDVHLCCVHTALSARIPHPLSFRGSGSTAI